MWGHGGTADEGADFYVIGNCGKVIMDSNYFRDDIEYGDGYV